MRIQKVNNSPSFNANLHLDIDNDDVRLLEKGFMSSVKEAVYSYRPKEDDFFIKIGNIYNYELEAWHINDGSIVGKTKNPKYYWTPRRAFKLTIEQGIIDWLKKEGVKIDFKPNTFLK